MANGWLMKIFEWQMNISNPNGVNEKFQMANEHLESEWYLNVRFDEIRFQMQMEIYNCECFVLHANIL